MSRDYSLPPVPPSVHTSLRQQRSHSYADMSTADDRGCAQDADGNLLSPSKIKWFEDADSVAPISESSPAASSSLKPMTLSRSLASANVLTAAGNVGARRSGRTIHPSTRLTDPDNAESRAFFAPSGAKRKASTAGGAHTFRRKVAEGSDSDDDVVEAPATSGGDTQDERDARDTTEKATSDEEDVEVLEANYASTKALGDADREVSIILFRCYQSLNF